MSLKLSLSWLKRVRYPGIFHVSRCAGVPVGAIGGVSLAFGCGTDVTKEGLVDLPEAESIIFAAAYGAFAGATWIEHVIACGVTGAIVHHKVKTSRTREEEGRKKNGSK
jgi:hypothetical protein